MEDLHVPPVFSEPKGEYARMAAIIRDKLAENERLMAKIVANQKEMNRYRAYFKDYTLTYDGERVWS